VNHGGLQVSLQGRARGKRRRGQDLSGTTIYSGASQWMCPVSSRSTFLSARHGDVTDADAFANSCTSSRADARVSRKDRKLVIHASCADDVIYVYIEFRTSLVFVFPYIAASKHIARIH